MATYNKFQDWPFVFLRKLADLRAAGDTLKIYLTNATPSASADVRKADLAEFAGGAGYTAGGADIVNDLSEVTATPGLWEVDTTASVTWTSTEATANWAAFRYVVTYDDTIATPTSYADALCNWWDYGSAVTLGPSESFTVTFTNSRLFTVQ